MGGSRYALLAVLVKVAAWVLSGDGLFSYAEQHPRLAALACRRTVQRWQRRLTHDAHRLQGALRTAVVERFEPQPVERLFPGGLSPPAAVRRRRWKDPEATYQLATGLAFLVHGAAALCTTTTVLLAEAHRRLDGPLCTPRT
jgi:hypothetical protein